MGRTQLLISTAIFLAAVFGAKAEERGTKEKPRQVAPGITMAPGMPKTEQTKSAKTAPKVETSKSQPTTYGERISPEPPVEAKVEEPKPSAPPVAVNAKPQPDPNAVSRPVAASPKANPRPPAPASQPAAAPAAPPENATASVQSEQNAAPPEQKAARREQVRTPNQRATREVRVGDRIPDDMALYDAPRAQGTRPRERGVNWRGRELKVGDRVPDDMMLYARPR